MKVASLRIRNFRTLEEIDIPLSPSYTAVCGANDSGKTNAVRALRALFRDDPPVPRYLSDADDITLKDDFTKWKQVESSDRFIEIAAQISVGRDRDAGLYQSIIKQLSLDEPPDPLELNVTIRHEAGKATQTVEVSVLGNNYSDIDAQEVLNRIQTARSVLFHNSTETHPRARFTSALGYIQDVPQEELQRLEKSTKALNNALAKIARGRQKEIEELLG